MTRTELLEQIEANDQIAVSALIALYARQTADEQQAQTTAHSNGVGFNGTDATILSSFAEQAITWRAAKKAGQPVRFASPLSEKQMALLRKKLPKYARQLEEIAEEKAARRAAASTPTADERPGEVVTVTQAQEDAAFGRIFGPDRFEREQMAERAARERLPEVNGFDVPASVVEQAKATVPGFETRDGAYVTEGFVYTDGGIFHRNGAKAVSRAVGEMIDPYRRTAPILQADPMDEFFA